jgi:hypothetical protein
VLVGLDRRLALGEIASRAPLSRSVDRAVERAAKLDLAGSGAAERIAAALTLVAPEANA